MELSRKVALLTGHILLALIIFCTQLTSFTWSILLVSVSVFCGSPSTLWVPFHFVSTWHYLHEEYSQAFPIVHCSSIFTNKPQTLRCGLRTKLAVKCFLRDRGRKLGCEAHCHPKATTCPLNIHTRLLLLFTRMSTCAPAQRTVIFLHVWFEMCCYSFVLLRFSPLLPLLISTQ